MVEEQVAASGDTRTSRKKVAILEAATEIFLRDGYLGASMDEVAAKSAVSKQTIYKHYVSKESLFIEIVFSLTRRTGDVVLMDELTVSDSDNLAAELERYAYRQLSIVLSPRVMQLRRLVIGEVGRFPDLARVLYENGPLRAMQGLAEIFRELVARRLLTADDPMTAASHFNWLVMAQPLNEVMLLGDSAIPASTELKRYAKEGVRA
ncbi:TetR/AcrR family transcriptional regulator, partial [Tabrizicola sp.]|uniref:TetR/AcrR family transcriptional regulator n=1 Tax=Tabrizicola sp. TaxID=2005166 RepID=UPI003F35A7BC